ncbi:MAG: DUF86 domain-containing protein [Patescibacteria group bacterium]
MSNDRKDYKLYLIDIKTSCTRILKYSKNLTKLQFTKNHLLTDAIEKNMEVIGEAGNKIPPEIKKSLPEIPWKDIVSLRNKLIHDYFDIDINVIWETVTNDIPILKKQINKVLKDLGENKLKLKK